MADDEAPEINEESKKDREEAEQAKALNAVTDNVSGSSNSNSGSRCPQTAHTPLGVVNLLLCRCRKSS
jgi:hypothetical protein